MVIYAGAEPPQEVQLFGRLNTWSNKDHDHIRIFSENEGPARGTFSIRGTREFNLLSFDLRKQIAAGFAEPDHSLFGRRERHLAAKVNAILDKAQTEGSLWFDDFDFTHFVEFHEAQWRPAQAT
jgi:hypothetical protein